MLRLLIYGVILLVAVGATLAVWPWISKQMDEEDDDDWQHRAHGI